ncbi:hypothetical protein DSUL_100223 [Desulfovibrionales bacterium]
MNPSTIIHIFLKNLRSGDIQQNASTIAQ